MFFGLNLDNPIRGSDKSNIGIPITLSSTPLYADVLYGPVVADISKRKNKVAFANKIVSRLNELPGKTLLIAGWYQNEILFLSKSINNEYHKVVYYENEKVLINYKNDGYKIYYLPEQEVYNDMRFKGEFTKSYAQSFNF